MVESLSVLFGSSLCLTERLVRVVETGHPHRCSSSATVLCADCDVFMNCLCVFVSTSETPSHSTALTLTISRSPPHHPHALSSPPCCLPSPPPHQSPHHHITSHHPPISTPPHHLSPPKTSDRHLGSASERCWAGGRSEVLGGPTHPSLTAHHLSLTLHTPTPAHHLSRPHHSTTHHNLSSSGAVARKLQQMCEKAKSLKYLSVSHVRPAHRHSTVTFNVLSERHLATFSINCVVECVPIVTLLLLVVIRDGLS